MGAIRDAFNGAYDDYVTSGVPSSGVKQTKKSEIRAAAGVVEDAVDAADAKAQTAIDTAQAGIRPTKDPVRVVITTNTAYASITAGSTHDGVVLASGDRVLRAYNGDTGDVLNGVLAVQPAGAAVRATDMDASGEVVGSRWVASAGTHAAEEWSVRNLGDVTLGTTPIVIKMSVPANAVSSEVVAARDGEASLGDKIATKADQSAVDAKADLADVFGADGDLLDVARQPMLVDKDEDGRVLQQWFSDATTDFDPSPELIAKLGGGVPEDAASNIDRADISSFSRVSDAVDRIWADPENLTLRRFNIRRTDGTLRTALMAGSGITTIMLYGQSNNEGNTNGGIVNDKATYPARVLMLSTGVLGSGNSPSGAASIPDFLPAHEKVAGALGESPGTSFANALARQSGLDDRKAYIVRNASKGGFTALKLAPGTVPYTNMIAEMERIKALTAIGTPVRNDAVLTYLQGETDATGAADELGVGPNLGTSAADYETRALNIFETAISDIEGQGYDSVLWIINQAGTNSSGSYCYANLPAAVLEKITREDTSGKILMGEPHYQFALYDNYHSTAPGKVKQGELNARTLRLIREGKRHAVQVESVTIAGGDIHVDFLLPDGVELHLIADATLVQHGFRLHDTPFVSSAADAGGDIAVSSVALAEVGGVLRRVVLTPATAPTAGQELRYAFKDNTVSDGDYYNARGGLATTSDEVFDLDGTPMRFFAPVFIRTLT